MMSKQNGEDLTTEEKRLTTKRDRRMKTRDKNVVPLCESCVLNEIRQHLYIKQHFI